MEEQNIDGFFRELSTMNFYDNSKMTNEELFQTGIFPIEWMSFVFLLEPITYANGSSLKDDPAITYGIVFSNFHLQGNLHFQRGN